MSTNRITDRMRECREAYDDAGQQAALECAARMSPLPAVAYCPACDGETYADDGTCLVCWHAVGAGHHADLDAQRLAEIDAYLNSPAARWEPCGILDALDDERRELERRLKGARS